MATGGPQKTVAVLGGGITGLSTAYYIRKKYGDLVRPIILERSPRVGGWIKTVRVGHGHNVFETGPRSVRPAGLPGLNTLDLVEELGLEGGVHFVPPSHPASLNRFIYTGGRLVKLPVQEGLRLLFKTVPPFERPLYRALIRDIFKRRVKDEDDSVYDFFERRFGRDIAEYLVDPMIRGVTAGDARQISTKFMFRQLYHYEQVYGSVVLGTIMNRLRKKPSLVDLAHRIPGHERIGFSKLACTSVEQNWAQWTLEEGLEELPAAMAKRLQEQGVELRLKCGVKTIKFGETRNVPSDHVEVSYLRAPTLGPDGSVLTPAMEEVLHCDHVISTIPAWRFSKILRKSKPSHPSLWQLLNLISAVDVVVVNLLYRNRRDILPEEAFGFLVPSSEAKRTPDIEGLLGVVFDTCSRAQGDDTVLTVMAHPISAILDTPTQNEKDAAAAAARAYLKLTLGVDATPDHVEVTFAEDCIPQYQIGHYEKVDGVRMFARAAKLPLLVAGASYDGVSVNDCIYSGRRAVEELPFTDLL